MLGPQCGKSTPLGFGFRVQGFGSVFEVPFQRSGFRDQGFACSLRHWETSIGLPQTPKQPTFLEWQADFCLSGMEGHGMAFQN